MIWISPRKPLLARVYQFYNKIFALNSRLVEKEGAFRLLLLILIQIREIKWPIQNYRIVNFYL